MNEFEKKQRPQQRRSSRNRRNNHEYAKQRRRSREDGLRSRQAHEKQSNEQSGGTNVALIFFTAFFGFILALVFMAAKESGLALAMGIISGLAFIRLAFYSFSDEAIEVNRERMRERGRLFRGEE